MHLGSNISIGNVCMFGGAGDAYLRLLSEGTMVGRDLTVTNTRTGARKSAFADSTQTTARHTVTANGNVKLTTSQKKFGTASITNNSATAANYAQLSYLAADALLNKDFVIEFWVYNEGTTSQFGQMVNQRNASGEYAYTMLHFGGAILFGYTTNGTSSTTASFALSLPTNEWHKITLARDGANLRCYYDADQIGATHNIGTSTIWNSSQPIRVMGDAINASSGIGKIDELRISLGTNRGYTGTTITVPTEAFTADEYTTVLLHGDGADASTTITDSAYLNQIGANEADELVINNRLYAYAAMNGATNLVSENLSDFNGAPNDASVTGTDLLVEGSGTGGHFAQNSYTATSTNGHFTAEFKPNGREWFLLQFIGVGYLSIHITDGSIGAAVVGGFVQGDISWSDLGDGYYRISVAGRGSSTGAYIYTMTDGSTFSYTGDGSSGFYVRNIRMIDNTVAHAAFPDASAAGASYGADSLSATVTIPVGTYIGWAMYYDDAGAAIVSKYFTAIMSGTGNLAAKSIAGAAVDIQHTIFNKTSGTLKSGNVGTFGWTWNGVTSKRWLNDSAKSELATVNTADTWVSDGSAGTLVGGIFFERELSDAEIDAFIAGTQADFATFGGTR